MRRTAEGAALLREATGTEAEALPPVSDPTALRALPREIVLLEIVRDASSERFGG